MFNFTNITHNRSELSVLHYIRYDNAMAQVQFADEMSTTITFVDSEACTMYTVTGDAPRCRDTSADMVFSGVIMMMVWQT
jgi:hypothetical protein